MAHSSDAGDACSPDCAQPTTLDLNEQTGFERIRWAHRLACVTTISMFVLLAFGGHVTTLQAGDTEPSWSLRFWHWFVAWSALETGHFFELTHRQWGTITGILAVALLAVIARWETRRRVIQLAAAVVVLVVLQGLLGGLRVLSVSSPSVAETAVRITGLSDAQQLRVWAGVIHAVLGLICFAMMTGIVTVTSRGWFQAPATSTPGRVRFFRGSCIALVGALIVQILLGAWLRHTEWTTAILLLHIFVALLIATAILLVLVMAFGFPAALRSIQRPAIGLTTLLMLQLLLGIMAFAVPAWDAGRSLHHLTGALLLATALAITLKSFKLLRVS